MDNNDYKFVMIVPFMKVLVVRELIESLLENNKKYLILLVLVDMSLGEEFAINSTSLLRIKRIQLSNKESSSHSRNIGIEYILKNDICFEYLLFPDDDTVFDSSFFELFEKVVHGNTIMNVLCKDTKVPYSSYKIEDGALLKKKDVLFVGCVRLILSKKTFDRVGYFDEQLGIGAKYGSGEDGDYFLRALAYDEFHYTDKVYNLHPSPSLKYKQMKFRDLVLRFNNYGKGLVYMLCKHRLYKESCIVCLRAIAGGGVALVAGKWRLACAYWFSFFTRLSVFLSKALIVK